MLQIRTVLVLAALVATPDARAAEPAASLQCECILGTSGLCGRVIGSVGGKSIVSWTQKFFKPPGGVNQDLLNAACYRKRDETGHGDGLCCEGDAFMDEGTIVKKLFRGTLK